MYYEIIVSLNGKHLFATAERSIVNTYQLNKVYSLFTEKFPKEEGYNITVTKWGKNRQTHGHRRSIKADGRKV